MKRYEKIAAFVLAGGASRRMGRDKALLELDGVPLVVRTARLVEPLVASVTIVGPPERYASLGLCVVADRWQGAGPLGGIATALSVSSTDWNLILGCDLPFLTMEWLMWLVTRAPDSSAQAVIPESRRGLEPLAALYHKDCTLTFSTALEQGMRRVSEALGEISCERATAGQWKAIASPDMLFRNVNTPEDFAEVQRCSQSANSHLSLPSIG